MRIAKIPPDLFKQVEMVMPFSSVDVVILKRDKVVLTKRRIPPYCGYWHLPGSVIMKGEKMVNTVRRSVKEELGIEVSVPTFVNCYELFTNIRHYIVHLFVAKYSRGEFSLDFQSSALTIVKPDEIPAHTIPAHKLEINDALEKINYSSL